MVEITNAGLKTEFEILQRSLHDHMNPLKSKKVEKGQYQQDQGLLLVRGTSKSSYQILNDLLYRAKHAAVKEKIGLSGQIFAQTRNIINSSIQITELLHHMDPNSEQYKFFVKQFHGILAKISVANPAVIDPNRGLLQLQKSLLTLEVAINTYASRHDPKFHPKKDEYKFQRL